MNRDTVLVAGVVIIMQLSLALMVDAIFMNFAVTLAAVGFSLTFLVFLYIIALYATERVENSLKAVVDAINAQRLQEGDILLAQVIGKEVNKALAAKADKPQG